MVKQFIKLCLDISREREKLEKEKLSLINNIMKIKNPLRHFLYFLLLKKIPYEPVVFFSYYRREEKRFPNKMFMIGVLTSLYFVVEKDLRFKNHDALSSIGKTLLVREELKNCIHSLLPSPLKNAFK